MPVAKAKKKKRVEKPVISEKQIRAVLDAERQKADRRYKYAKRILDANKPELAETAERMAEILGRGTPNKLRIDGVSVEVDEDEIRAINDRTRLWVAVRLLVAAAEWDIRIQGLKLPKSRCARCGRKVK